MLKSEVQVYLESISNGIINFIMNDNDITCSEQNRWEKITNIYMYSSDYSSCSRLLHLCKARGIAECKQM